MGFEKTTYEAVTSATSPTIMHDWMLITAGTEGSYNTMLASWGGVGTLWGTQVAFIFVRDSRHTKKFVDASESFTLTFFNKDYRDALYLCGTVSGRDRDKVSEAGLTPVHDEGITYFDQAAIVFSCRKLSETLIPLEDVLDRSIIERFYEDEDCHTMYIGKIDEVLVNKDNF